VSSKDDESMWCSSVDDRWVIDHEEYLGLVKVLVRARAVVKSFKRIGDGAVRIPPRAASDLRETLQEFAQVDQARRNPCRLKR
jgi:hypothetical protein